MSVGAGAAGGTGALDGTVAVCSVSGRWPGGCEGVGGALWSMMQASGDAVGQVPAARWVLEEAVDMSLLSEAQEGCVRHGGFLAGAQRFDGSAFGVSPAEASAMDPQQRLLLEIGVRGAARVGRTVGRRCWAATTGVFLGIERPDWALAQPAVGAASVYAVTGDNVSVAAGRLSFVLGLQGPCSSVDTACSSALVALHGGAHAVPRGECARLARQ